MSNLSENFEEYLNEIPQIDFDLLWELIPEEKHKVRMGGRLVEVPRYSQSYLRNYSYTGNIARAKPLPDILRPFLNYAREYDERFNQILVNWYEDGHNYIGPHSDDERQLIQNSPIMSISLGQERKFRIRNKRTVYTFCIYTRFACNLTLNHITNVKYQFNSYCHSSSF